MTEKEENGISPQDAFTKQAVKLAVDLWLREGIHPRLVGTVLTDEKMAQQAAVLLGGSGSSEERQLIQEIGRSFQEFSLK